jgi:hypothetical protein
MFRKADPGPNVVQRHDICPDLVGVAVDARQREVGRDRGSVMLAGGDMVDLEGGTRSELRQAAVFASPARTLPHQLDQGSIHAVGRPMRVS